MLNVFALKGNSAPLLFKKMMVLDKNNHQSNSKLN